MVAGATDNWALTLTDTLGTAPADGAVVSVTESNTDTTLAVTAVAYDRWFEVANKTGTVETDTLRGIEQLLFSDVALDLSFKTAQKAVLGDNGLTTVTKVTGTELADILRPRPAMKSSLVALVQTVLCLLMAVAAMKCGGLRLALGATSSQRFWA